MKSVISFLQKNGIRYRLDCCISELSTFKVGGPVDLVLYPQTAEQCKLIILLAKEKNKELFFLGNGSNILGSDKGCSAWILKTDDLNRLELGENGLITVGAGVKGVKLSSFAAKNGLTGAEFMHGIPGSVGGFVFMNAGAYGGSMDQIVVETTYMDSFGEIHLLQFENHQFGYRNSFFLHHPELLILETKIKLVRGDVDEIHALINELQSRRKEKQPLEYPSAGSTFKRPEGFFAGKLIEDAGLKGYKVGGAQVSEKHAGFIINTGNATGSDVRSLICYVQRVVKEKFGVDLKCEVRYLGEE